MGLIQEIKWDSINKKGWPWNTETNQSIYGNKIYWPKISIVTPSFNQGLYIEETIRSVLLQNYPNLEYIIIDGGSTDNTVEIIKKYEEWLTYWVSEPDRGQSHAINKGLEKCSGDIFNWINSDDYLEPNALFKIAGLFKGEVLLVTGKTRILEANGTTWYKKGHHRPFFDEKAYPLSHFFQVSTYISSKAVEELGGLSESLHYVMDVEWHLKFLLYFGYGNIVETDYLLANYRHHESSKSRYYENKFLPEIHLLFYKLAVKAGLDNESVFIDTYILTKEIKQLNYSMKLDLSKVDQSIIINTIHNFIWEFITKFYVSGKLNAVKEAFSFIRRSNLSENNKKVYDMYSFKIKYLYHVVRSWRNIKTVFN